MTANKTSVKPDDLQIIDPENGEFLIEGIPAVVKRIKAREFFKLLGVITIGMGSGMGQISLSGEKDEAIGQFLGLMIAAIPEAGDEFADFLSMVVEAKDPRDNAVVAEKMRNPELDTMLDALTLLAEQEAPGFSQLVGKARAAFARIQSVYQNVG